MGTTWPWLSALPQIRSRYRCSRSSSYQQGGGILANGGLNRVQEILIANRLASDSPAFWTHFQG
jgi:hypothetical protein